jgi:hypothetical protein
MRLRLCEALTAIPHMLYDAVLKHRENFFFYTTRNAVIYSCRDTYIGQDGEVYKVTIGWVCSSYGEEKM